MDQFDSRPQTITSISVDSWRTELLRRIHEVEQLIDEQDCLAAKTALSRLQTRLKILLESVEGE